MLNTLIFIFMAIVGGVPCDFNAPKYNRFLSYGNFTVNVNIIYRCMINFIHSISPNHGMCPNTCTR